MPSANSQAKHREPARADLAYRPLTIRAQSEADKAAGAIPVTLATENPVRVWDKTLRKVVSEVLLMAGAEVPKQVPMLDDHAEQTSAVVGSIRGLTAVGDELHGASYFSSKRNAQDLKQDVLDGHVTDMSVGAERLEEVLIDTGDEKTVMGRRFKGPARIVTRWRPFHGAVVTRGADSRSVFSPAMRAYSHPESFAEEAMTSELRSHLESLGMPKEISDDATLTWLKENTARKQTLAVVDPKAAKPDSTGAAIVEVKDADAIKRAAAEGERTRITTIRTSVKDAGLDDAFADKLIGNDTSTERAAQAILTELSTRAKAHGRGADIKPTGSEADSFRKAALDGVTLRLGGQVEKPSPGALEFRHTRILDLARKSLEVEGVTTRGMTDRDVMGRAFAINYTTRASDGQAYLHSGNFSNLLLDAQNKELLKAFNETQTTYQFWVGMRASVPDFKNIHAVRLGEVGNQPVVEENGDYKDMSLSDAKEIYVVQKRGSIVSLTFEALKNDDLGGFSRIVAMQGAAMKRTINRSVYQIFFDNAALSDGTALFHTSSHGANKVTVDLSVANLNAAFAAMALQTGINTDVILGLVPQYLIVASGIWADAAQILNSTSDPAAGGSTTTGNANTHNVYGPNGSRRLQLIEEPILSGNDADSWYLATNSNICDTVQLAFLQGEETPVFEQDTAFVQDAVKYKIRQTWGCAAVDYRGLYQSLGTG